MSKTKISAAQIGKPIDWLPFPEASRILERLHQATREEIAIWVFLGAGAGGLDGYLDAPMYGVDATPPRCSFDDLRDESELLLHLMRSYFDRAALEAFLPGGRYVTHEQAVEKILPFANDEASVRALLLARAESGELDALHPITVVTQHCHGHGVDPRYEPLEKGMFAKSAIDALIASNFPGAKTTYLAKETHEERDRRLQARAEELYQEGLGRKPPAKYRKNKLCTLIFEEEKTRSKVTFDRLQRIIRKPK